MAREYDVIIVGAGMVGALTAVLTAQKGLTVALIDKHSGRYPLSTPPAYDARVSAISALSQTLLEQAGAWQRIAKERLAPYQRMAVWDGLGDGYVDFDVRYQQAASLGQLVENAALCDALMKSVHDTRGIDLYFDDAVASHQEQESGVEVVLASDRSLRGAVLIAADGANSNLRQQNNVDTVEWDYGHHAIVTTVEIDAAHEDTAWQAFGEEGILAFLPMPSVADKHYVSIVWSVSPADAEQLMALEEDAFCRRLTYAINRRFTALSLTVPRMAIPLRQRHAKHYVQPGFVLIGDAAHTIHPLVREGHVFVAMPPLYRIDMGKEVHYALDDEEKDIILHKLEAENKRGTPNVQRFKGLGEMNPAQLRETTMAPDTRRLIQLTMEDPLSTGEVLDKLLSKKRANDRKTWLETYGNLAVVD
jgi:2-octaprenylphenol hydroxylase